MSQVLAIVWLRRRLLVNRLRRGEGVWDLVGTILLGVLWGVAALGAAIGLGAVMLPAARSGDESLLFKLQTGVFLAVFLAGTVLPLMVEKSHGEVVTGRLLAFPVTPVRLFWVSQTALALSADHLFYLPALLTVAVAVVAGPGSAIAGFGVVLVVWLGVLAWGQAVQLGTEVLLRGRRSREILAVVVLLLILAMSMGPAVVGEYLETHPVASGSSLQGELTVVLGIGRSLAPWQAAAALQAARAGTLGPWSAHLGGVLLWVLAGLMVSRMLFTSFYLGGKGSLGAPRVAENPVKPAIRPLEWRIGSRFLPPETTANAMKDLRLVLRSLPGRLLLVLTPLLMAFIGWSVLKDLSRDLLGLEPTQLRYYGMFVYISLTSNNFSINNMAFENGGVQAYFLLPGRLPWVLLGKNIGLWLYQLLLLVICLVVLLVVGSRPGAATLVNASLVYGCLVVFRTLVGNLLSCLFPVPRPMSSPRNRPSGMANLLSFAAFLLFIPLVWLAAALPALVRSGQGGVWGLSGLFVVTVGIHLVSLRPVAALWSERRERILAALEKSDN